MPNRVASWLAGRRLPLDLAVLVIALGLTSLGVGWQVDDHFQRWAHLGFPGAPDLALSRGSFFTFADGNPARTHRMMDLGIMPWWTDERFRLSFWRPLSVLTHGLDYSLWPGRPAIMHAHNLLWFGAMVAAAAVLYRRWIGATWAAGLAAFLYAVDDAHGFPAGWIANRNALIGTLFGLLALAAHDRWRRSRRLAFALWAPLAFAAGLLGAEAATGAAAYLVAYALFLDPAPRARRALSLVPYAIIGIAWQVIYRHLGYGATGSALYIDPGEAPLRFVAAVAERLPILLLGQWWPVPIDLYIAAPLAVRISMWIIAMLLIGTLLIVFVPLLRRDGRARFFALGMLLSLLPICATMPMTRLLLFAGFGAMGLAALWIRGAIDPPPWWPATPGWRRLAKGTLVYCVAVHVVLGPLLLPLAAWSPALFEFINREIASAPRDAAITQQDFIVVASPDPYGTGFLPVVRWVEGGAVPARIRRLASSHVPLVVTRPDRQSLVVRAETESLSGIDGPMVRTPAHAMTTGQRVTLTGLTVTVLSVAENGLPDEASFVFPVALEDPSLRWARWSGDRFVPFTLPPIGASIRLPPDSPLPFPG